MGSIVAAQQLVAILDGLRANGKKIVFTNGCFDLLHLGHARYLDLARRQGDALVVAINSDASVRSIKGPTRPLIPQDQRAELLAGLEAVDFVTIFDEPDPLRILDLLKPDVLVKGGDWRPDQIVGRELVESYGGRVISAELTRGYSTTNILEKILELPEPIADGKKP